MPIENEDQKELKDLLKRGEVNTMQKDISALRESQSEQERERIKSMTSQKEAGLEKERRARALKEAEERQRVEAEKRKRDEIEKQKNEQERKYREEILRKMEQDKQKKQQVQRDAEVSLPHIHPMPAPKPAQARPVPPPPLPPFVPTPPPPPRPMPQPIAPPQKPTAPPKPAPPPFIPTPPPPPRPIQPLEKPAPIREEFKEVAPPPNLPIEETPEALPVPQPKNEKIFGGFGKKTKELWRIEDEKRKQFLERVTGFKDGQRPRSPVPAPQSFQEQPMAVSPTRPSAYKKILIRTIFAAAILILIGAGVWYFVNKKPSPSQQEPPADQNTTTPAPSGQEQTALPASLISVDSTQTIEIANSAEAPVKLMDLLEKKPEKEAVTRLAFKNTQTNSILGLKEFFEAFEIKFPQTAIESLNNDFTLFVRAKDEKNRLGFVAKINDGKKDNLKSSLSEWEKTAEKDTEKFFTIQGKLGPAPKPAFKTSQYSEIDFRYLTFSRDDFGLVYGIVGDYFIFTTSFESMHKSIDLVKGKSIGLNAGQLFMIGFEGKTITPELEQIFEKYKPGGVLLLGRNIESASQLRKLTNDLQELSMRKTGLPLFIAVDQEGGSVSRVAFAKERTAQSEIDNASEAYLVSKRRAEELKELGINLDLAPLLDVASKGDFVFSRSFKANPPESGDLAKYLILGQKETGLLTAIKHFPGYGGITTNPENLLATVQETPEVSQFVIAMEADPEFVMTSNVVYNEIDPTLPFTFSAKAIEFTKKTVGSNAIIISDDLAQNSLLNKYSLKDVLIKPVQAGVDILIFSGWDAEISNAFETFHTALENGEIPQANITEAVSRIIQLKQKI